MKEGNNMFSTKKLLCMVLTVLMCIGMLAGCNSKNVKDPETPSESAGTTAPDEEKQVIVPEDFGSADGTPRKFAIMTRNGTNRSRYVHAEEASSDRVEQAAYERNAYLESVYNIDFEIVKTKDDSGTWANALLGSGDSYDLCVPDYWWGLESQGLMADILQMPEIDIRDPWWYSSWGDVSIINNKLYSILGDASNEAVENLPVVFFNKTIAEQNSFDFYAEVEQDNWTWERMKIVCRQVAANLTDDDTSNDMWGLMTEMHSARNFVGGIGLKLTEKTATGYFQLVENQDNNYTLTEDVRDFIHSSGVVNHVDTTTRRRDRSLFVNGRSLFYASALLMGETMKNEVSGFKYGVLICPKLDKGSEYISVLGCSVYAIPRSAQNHHMSATVLNAINYMGADSTLKAYYDIVCQGQVADQPDDGKQMELARQSAKFDFAFIRENEIPLWAKYTQILSKNLPVASEIQPLMEASRTALADIMNAYMK